MSVRQALAFIQAVRTDETLREQINALSSEITLAALVQLASETGFSFTKDELEAAHRQDWSMRSLRYHLIIPGEH